VPEQETQASAQEENGHVVLDRIQNDLVRDLMLYLRRYVVMPEEFELILATWVIHTHCTHLAYQTPYIAVTSPEKQCGKSRLIECLELVVANPWSCITPSEAVLYRHIDQKRPTVLLDEVDTIFNPRSEERHEGIRAAINAGHRKGATVPRCLGTSQEIAQFHVFCPKLLAGIGVLPETVADRAIPIRLERKKRSEPVERFRRRKVEPSAVALRSQVEAWVSEHQESLRDAEPEMPDALSDRMQEGCECLVAIADKAGCGDEVRAALVSVLTAERLDSQETMRISLLKDIRTIWSTRLSERNMLSRTLLAKLKELKESPWHRLLRSRS
jgi:hypothetical protein